MDPSIRHQTMDGFGSSIMTWWDAGPFYTEAWQRMYYEDLGASMLRMDMNANVFA